MPSHSLAYTPMLFRSRATQSHILDVMDSPQPPVELKDMRRHETGGGAETHRPSLIPSLLHSLQSVSRGSDD